MTELRFKDESVAFLAKSCNVAQFVSFDPNLKQRFSAVAGFDLDHRFDSIEDAARALFKNVGSNGLTIRSYDPARPQGWPLVRAMQSVEEVVKTAKRLTSKGLYIILHEELLDERRTSGVLLGDVIEFALLATPRCVEANEVEKFGIPASLPREVGFKILEVFYGFRPNLDFDKSLRIEWSVCPKPYGQRQDHVIVWDLEEVGEHSARPLWSWPNRFSRYVGDKTFGLMVADAVGLNVPMTHAISREGLFSFGKVTGSNVKWTRTAPAVLTPGKFPTVQGYADVFKMLQDCDPGHDKIAAVLIQHEVPPVYSGALFRNGDDLHIEGVKGRGDDFMVGKQAPEVLPDEVREKLASLYYNAEKLIGPVRLEWVYDGSLPWVVQLHVGKVDNSHPDVIVEGSPSSFERFVIDPDDLEAFRQRVDKAKAEGVGLEVVGNFGLTSHIGDILRKAGVPSRRVKPQE